MDRHYDAAYQDILEEQEMKKWYQTNKFPTDEKLLEWYQEHQKKLAEETDEQQMPTEEDGKKSMQDLKQNLKQNGQI